MPMTQIERQVLDMGKLDDKKRKKRDSLLTAAFRLFTEKGINDTSISDIAREAKMAKGTFYLYFKDKFDIRDKLIATKAKELFETAFREMGEENLLCLEERIIYLADWIINRLDENKILLRFISKNLSWGVLRSALVREEEVEGHSFYQIYTSLLEESGRQFRNPELMLYMIVELVNATCHNVILLQEPVTLQELKPELYHTIRDIIRRQEIEEGKYV